MTRTAPPTITLPRPTLSHWQRQALVVARYGPLGSGFSLPTSAAAWTEPDLERGGSPA